MDLPYLSSKKYQRRMPVFWWVHHWVHIRFILRELTSIFVAAYAMVFLLYIQSLGQGEEAFAAFSAKLQSPAFIALHVLALVALTFHSITWFNLAPKAMVVKIGKHQVPGTLIALSNYMGWVVVSAIVTWYVLTY